MRAPLPRLIPTIIAIAALAFANGCGSDAAVDGGGTTTSSASQSASSGGSSSGGSSSGGFSDDKSSADAGSTGNEQGGGSPASSGSGSSSGGSSSGGSSSGGSSSGGSSSGAGSSSGSNTNPGSGGTSGQSNGGSSGKKTGDKPGEKDGKPTPGDKDKTNGKPPVCNKKDDVVLYLSADDSNSMAGAQVARGLIAQGQHVYKGLRTYEFLNYYNFDYPAAKKGHVAVSAQMRAEKDGAYHLQLAVAAPQITAKERRKAHIVLAVDTSSSMSWGPIDDTGIDRARAACMALVGSLDKGDLFSMVTWGGLSKVVIAAHKVASSNEGKLNAACQGLKTDGVTNLGGGLKEAYALASKHFDKALINRVVLVSDGGTNVGEKDKDVIAKAAKAADGKAIYLMGVGVGDPWNYNDELMNTVTDAGKGAYVFIDAPKEAQAIFGSGLLRHVELAARDVQVELTLPPTFAMKAFHGEQVSTNKDEVEPQHLGANDAMIFHQVVQSCDPKAIGADAKVKVKATWKHPSTGKEHVDTFEAKITDLLKTDGKELRKGDAVVAYVEALKALRALKGKEALVRIDKAIAAIDAGMKLLPSDKELSDLKDLLLAHKAVYAKGQVNMYPTGGTGAKKIGKACACTASGSKLQQMSCALGVCDKAVVLGQSYSSPTGSTTTGTAAVSKHFGNKSNHLAPREGGSYVLMATGPAEGTSHSKNMGGTSMKDPFAGGSGVFNAMEWKLELKAPEGAQGFRLNHIFFSQEYDEYVGSQFNDKFYMVLEAGSTNGGKKTVINYTKCRNPDKHYDFICSPGMQFCNPRQRYCYIAINTAASECCWLGGCPNGEAKTDISGTGFSCAASKSQDSSSKGSSTGWMTTEWPIEPGEKFTLTFHVHDTGDGVFDSEVILDNFQFVGSVTPGTWPGVM